MQNLIDFLENRKFLTESSQVIDIGSGTGKPACHFAAYSNCVAIGVENSKHRYMLSKVGLMNILNAKNSDVAYPNFLHCDIMDINSLNPCTICYQFDSLFVAKVQKYIAKLFNKSKSCQYLVSYNALKAVKNFGFQVTLVHKLPVSMMSSGEGKTCHIYQKLETAISKSTLQDDDDIDPKIQQLLSTRSVGREEFLESINEEVNTWLTTKPDSRQTRGSRAKA